MFHDHPGLRLVVDHRIPGTIIRSSALPSPRARSSPTLRYLIPQGPELSSSPEAAPDGVEDEGKGEHHRLVEQVAHDATRAPVVPAPVDQEKLTEKGKLAYGVVGGVHGLQESAVGRAPSPSQPSGGSDAAGRTRHMRAKLFRLRQNISTYRPRGCLGIDAKNGIFDDLHTKWT